ncbi:unnamed protein product (macronuclear) [Paramecium tetraurelia]|uniref:TRAFD1/XAF1 zinc finger domain-containing protein n=1 Tax=Paramecium tetraurelia TaxID=5888 RepID=A0DSH7_PARTE|nr:uncharacterized protein GSPATT00019698001 [Paramecium tetraurelia]CAK85994.1 unnamed protein product [Paramecium tetraurelia]|eukprot:XP_001453391.1 hypothetical protein (macronuclear) [Paramecium tetraurelia strain d4-2]
MNANCSPCSNCNQLIEETKLVLHETYCIRFNIKCDRCGQYYDKNDPESHEEDYHKKEKCQYCYVDFDDLSKHKCQKTPQLCLYCELSYPLDQIYQHENQCGSRTEKCQMCQNYVMKRDLNAHNQKCSQETQLREKQIQRPSSIQEKRQIPNEEINKVYQQQKSQQKQSNIDALSQQVKTKKQVPQQQQQQQVGKIQSKEISFGSIQKQTSLQHQVSQDNKQKEQIEFDKYFKYQPIRPPSSNSLLKQRPSLNNNKPSISQNRIRQQSNQKQVNPKGEVNNLLASKSKNSNLPPIGRQIQNPKRNPEAKNSNQDVRTKSLQSRQQVKRSVQNCAEKKEQIEIEGLRFSEEELMQQKMILDQLKQQKRDSNFKEQPLVNRQNQNSKAKASIDHSEFGDQGDFDQFMSPEERAMQQFILENYQLNSKKQ